MTDFKIKGRPALGLDNNPRISMNVVPKTKPTPEEAKLLDKYVTQAKMREMERKAIDVSLLTPDELRDTFNGIDLIKGAFTEESNTIYEMIKSRNAG